jgi:hypothetical protein
VLFKKYKKKRKRKRKEGCFFIWSILIKKGNNNMASFRSAKFSTENIDDKGKESEMIEEIADIRPFDSAIEESKKIIKSLEDERRKLEIAVAPGSLAQTDEYVFFGRSLPSSVSLIDRLQGTFQPKKLSDAIDHSYAWYEKDDLYGGLIDVKKDFLVHGFKISVTKKQSDSLRDLETLLGNETENNKEDTTGKSDAYIAERLKEAIEIQELEEKLKNFSIEFDLTHTLETAVLDYLITDSMVLYWRTIPGGAESQEVDANINLSEINNEDTGVIDINSLKINDILWEDTLGADMLSVKIPNALKARIEIAIKQKDNSVKNRMIEELLKQGVSERLIKAVEDGDDFIRLDKEEGDNWIVKTKERRHYGLAKPSATKIFLPLAVRLMNSEGEFAAAVMMKHFIFHIKCGESIESGPNAGSTKNWATQEEVDHYTKQFTGINKTKVIATNHTVEFSFVFPPAEIFSETKFASVNARIVNHVGVSLTLFTGEGGKYGGGYLSIKRLISSIMQGRSIVKEVFDKMLNSTDIRESLDIPDEYTITCSFGELQLKEHRQILDEVEALFDRHILSPDDALKDLGRDPSKTRGSLIKSIIENKYSKLWAGVEKEENINDNNNNKSNNKSNRNAGRPANPGTVVSDETREQDPRPGGE